jgi:iron complex transport system ATP-binding protein
VRAVVLLGRLPQGRIVGAPGAADHAVVDAVLDRLAIAHLARRAFTELSGGERQLVLIARALAQGARLLLLDEPAAGLDYGNQLRLLALLRRLAAEGCGVLLTTHQPEHVLLGSDRVLVLGAGQVVAEGPPRRVVTRELMRRLYGVDAKPIELADGRVAIAASMPP